MGKNKKESVLIWGNGGVLRENIVWIKQLYEVIGITGKNVKENDHEKKTFVENEAIKLQYDKIMITSMYYEEIRDKLINCYSVQPFRIIFFLDEFKQERKISFGEKNTNITMYIWRLPYYKHKNGFMNFFEELFVVYHFCQQKGYELLVDMKNYYSKYMRGDSYGSVNVWEFFFCSHQNILWMKRMKARM